MYIKRNYSFWMTLKWSYKPFLFGVIYGSIITVTYLFLKSVFQIEISFPWQPISVLGIAVAFYLGFKNNASYDRTWEARKIWGSIVNNSRAFGAAVVSFVQGQNKETIHQQLLYQHIAWLTILRYQLRTSRQWEHPKERLFDGYSDTVKENSHSYLRKELDKLLSQEEMNELLNNANPPTQILKKQAIVLQKFHDDGHFDSFRHMAFHKLITTFYEDQGKSERIKNFPFPRQYASVALWQTYIFSALIPFGMLNVFSEIHSIIFWLTIPFSGLLIWVFFLMEKIGDYSENPFEGSYNDIPIDSIARAIEIDLLQMMDETNIPEPIQSKNNFLM